MMRSMFTAVSGLRTHQTKMDVIGNNIANVNTVGFKSSSVTFKEIFSQTTQGATAPNAATGRGGVNPMQIGLGVSIASIDNIMTQGAAQVTDNPLDMMINGDAFFVVGDDNGKYFTRAGAFRLDLDGNLVAPGGLRVYGWPAVDDGPGAQRIEKGAVEPLVIKSAENLSVPATASSLIEMEGNLNITDGQTPEGIKQSLSFHDSLGNKYTVEVTLRYDSKDSLNGVTSSKWTVEWPDSFMMNGKDEIVIKAPDTASTFFAKGVTANNPLELHFDTGGKFLGTNPAAAELNGANLTRMIQDVDGGNISATANDIKLDFSALTQYQQKTTVKAYDKDGVKAGSMNGFSIGEDGKVWGSYSNGARKLLGQIAVASFKNPGGLEKVGDNLFAATANSGEFDGIGEEPQANGGSLGAGRLEMSNVDIAQQFTEMITTQRGFQANSRIISTSDEILQELVNLKR